MKSPVLPLLVLLALATPTWGIEFDGAFRGQTGYDSNAVQGGEGDMVVELLPRMELRDPDGRLTWGARYAPTWRYFVTSGTNGGWSHIVSGDVTWIATPKLSFTATERFARVKNIDLEDTFTPTDPSADIPDTELADDRSKNNQATFEIAYSPTPRDQITAQALHNWRSFDDERRGDLTIVNGTLGYRRRVNTSHTGGIDLSYTRNEVDNPIRMRTEGTDFYNLSAVWAYDYDDTLRFFASGGPTWVKSDDLDEPAQAALALVFPQRAGDPDGQFFLNAKSCDRVQGFEVTGPGCDVVPRRLNDIELAVYGADTHVIPRDPRDRVDDETSSLTYFAQLQVTKEWGRWQADLAYLRRASTSASDVGSDTVADTLSLGVTWDASARFRLNLQGLWVRRTQENTVRGDRIRVVPVTLNGCGDLLPNNPSLVVPACGPRFGRISGVAQSTSLVSQQGTANLVQDQYLLRVTALYRLRRNLFVTASGNYRYIQDDSDVVGTSSDDRWRMFFGLEYRFDPITVL